jgi:hypothetical protein
VEFIPASQIDTTEVSVLLSGEVAQTDVALIVQNGDKYLINSNLVNIEASFVLSGLLSGRLNRPVAADVVIANGKALIFAEYDSQVDIDLPWSGTTHLTRYDPLGAVVSDRDTTLLAAYATSLLRGDLVVLVDDSTSECWDSDADGYGDPSHPENTCSTDNCPLAFNPLQEDTDQDSVGDSCDNCPEVYNPEQADSDEDGIGDLCEYRCGDPDGSGVVEVADAVYLVNYIFLPGSPAPDPYESGDPDCSGVVEVADAVFLINYIFVPDAPTPCDPDNDTVPDC